MTKKTKSTNPELRYIRKQFENNLQAFGRLQAEHRNDLKKQGIVSDADWQWQRYDMDTHRYARRRRAAEEYLDAVRDYMEENYPDTLFLGQMAKDEPERFSFAARWGKTNSHILIGYDGLNNDTSLTLAAAIWILDRIRDYNRVPFLNENGEIEKNEYGYAKTRLAKLMEILPSVDETDIFDLPHIWDSRHSEEVLREVVYVIEHRNDDCVGKRYKGDHIARPFIDCFTTEGTQHQDVPSRKRFDTLLALIPEEDKEDMAVQYEQLMWEWMSMFFTTLSEYWKKQDEQHIKYDQKEKELDDLWAQLNRDLKSMKNKPKAAVMGKGSPIINPALMNPLLMNPAVKSNSFMPEHFGEAAGYADQLQRGAALEKSLQRIDERFVELLGREREICHIAEDLFTQPQDMIAARINVALKDTQASIRASDAFCGLAIKDPYGVCFGLLYLIDSDSDLPWLYFPSLYVAQLTAAHLPWYNGSYEEEEDDIWGSVLFGDEEEEIIEEVELTAAELVKKQEQETWLRLHKETKYPKSLRVPEMPDWYRLNVESESKDESFIDRTSLSQLIYDQTGGIMPRDMKRYEAALPALSEYGIRGKKTLAYEYAMLLMGEAQRQTSDWRRREAPVKKEPDSEVDTAINDDELRQLKQQLAELKKENAVLRETAYSADRAARDERRKNEKLKAESEKERQELYALREVVFARENGADDEAVEETIALPYSVGKRTVVFGGHDSWAKAIKPMLEGNIRFVTRSTKPSPDLIRHADIIWIQANSLSHKEYYTIMNVVRTNDIPVEYFKYASAEKCARQLAERDAVE